MALRQDGRQTRARLLDAACEVFAERGYGAAKVADICRRADANVAAVNYHFGDKASLYMEAWKHAYTRFAASEQASSEGASPEEQLRDYVHTVIRDFFEQGQRGQFTRLYLMELVNPTGLIHDIWHELIEPRRKSLLRIISAVSGFGVNDQRVLFCELSIISQCRVVHTIRPDDLTYLLGEPLSPRMLKRLADHVTRFSLAGIKAIAEGPSGNQ